MGLLLALNFYYFGLRFEFFSNTVFIILLIAISIICNQTMLIPNEFTLPWIIVAFLSSFVKGGITPLDSIFGFLLGGGLLLLVYIFYLKVRKVEGLGQGTIKAMAMSGVFLGPQKIVISILLFSSLALFIGLYMVIAKGIDNKLKLSTGELLGIGAVISLFWGDQIFVLICSLYI